MKKLIGILAALFLLVSFVSAVDVDVDCKSGWWDSGICMDYELDDEFDEVEEAINDNTDYITDNEDSWSKDTKGGTNLWDVSRMIAGDGDFLFENNFIEYLDVTYVTKQEVVETNNRIDRLEAMIMVLGSGKELTESNISLYLARLKAGRTGVKTKVNGHTCFPDGMCVNVN